MIKYSVCDEKNVADVNEELNIYVGSRLKMRRNALKITQNKLGSHLGISFQQIQKYEKGKNRISVSMLQNIAEFLLTEIGYFVEGFNAEFTVCESSAGWDAVDLMKYETENLIRSYYKIKDDNVRQKILEMIQSLQITKSP